MKSYLFLSALVMMLVLAACGGGKTEANENEESTGTTSSSGAQTSEEPANMQDAMKQAEEAMKNLQNGQQTEPVNFRKLQELLPEKLAGFERKSKSGETSGVMGFNISRAEASYEKGNCNAEVEMLDTGGMSTALIGMAAWASVTIDKEDDEGYERTSTLDGYKCFEKFRKNGPSSELSILVNNRFIVTANGRDCEMDELKKLIKAMDLGDLEKI
jgi:hypothetical protein